MNVKYDTEMLKKIIDDVFCLTGVSMAIMDLNFRYLYSRTKPEDTVCINVQKTERGTVSCRCDDLTLVRRCASEMRAVSHICHAGLRDTAMPIIKNGNAVGYIIIGRIRPKKDSDSAPISTSYTCRQEIAEHYDSMTYLTDSQLECLIDLLTRILFENAIQIEYNDLVTRARDYIISHISERLTVEDICAELFVSKNKLYKSFHSYYGTTVNEFITSTRLNLAERLLAEGEKSIPRVAAEVGFPNYTYFTKLFKRHVGVSPAAFRRMKG